MNLFQRLIAGIARACGLFVVGTIKEVQSAFLVQPIVAETYTLLFGLIQGELRGFVRERLVLHWAKWHGVEDGKFVDVAQEGLDQSWDAMSEAERALGDWFHRALDRMPAETIKPANVEFMKRTAITKPPEKKAKDPKAEHRPGFGSILYLVFQKTKGTITPCDIWAEDFHFGEAGDEGGRMAANRRVAEVEAKGGTVLAVVRSSIRNLDPQSLLMLAAESYIDPPTALIYRFDPSAGISPTNITRVMFMGHDAQNQAIEYSMQNLRPGQLLLMVEEHDKDKPASVILKEHIAKTYGWKTKG